MGVQRETFPIEPRARGVGGIGEMLAKGHDLSVMRCLNLGIQRKAQPPPQYRGTSLKPAKGADLKLLTPPKTKKQEQRQRCKVTDVFMNLVAVIISPCLCVLLHHHVVRL